MSSPATLFGALMLTSALALPAGAAPPIPTTGSSSPPAGELRLGLEKLATVGRVLYVAAHPDDENTRLLAYLAGDRKVRVAYAALTRGDGGQNLVGAELGPLLGLVRTYELLAARSVDDAEQLFSRAVDFGYSKSAEETLRVWGHDAILSDLVRVVRTFRPDVIVTRFNTQPPNHGHHTASALLAREAFTAAADPRFEPGGPPPHQARVLLENKSHWRFKDGEDLSQYLSVDVGTYSPLLGRSFSEVAAASRTMHKSQGFGTAPEHGPVREYFEVTATAPGVSPPDKDSDPFGEVATSWARYPKTERLRAELKAALDGFAPDRPADTLPALARVRAELAKLPSDNPARAAKLADVDALLVGAAGLVLDPRAKSEAVVSGVPAPLTATVVARATGDVILRRVTWPDGASAPGPGRLARGALTTVEHTLELSDDVPYSTPFWLTSPPEPATQGGPPGRFVVADRDLAIRPVGPPDLPVAFELEIAGAQLTVVRPLVHGVVDRVHGERLRPVEVLPPVTVTPSAQVMMLPNGAAGPLRVRVMAHADGQSGAVSIAAPKGYRVAPSSAAYSLANAGDATELTFTVTPPRGTTTQATLEVIATLADDRTVALRRDAIDHLHIPARTVLSPATVQAVPFVLKTGGRRVGYIQGAGDGVADALRQVGYDVTLLDHEALATGDLQRFDAIVAGIRAYNVDPTLGDLHPRLMRYVERGGTYVVQYVTSTRWRPLGDVPIGPYPFTIDRGRVTDESAAMTPVDPKSAALRGPNRIVAADYDGWVQERGLYFAGTWDPRYQTVFSAHDAGEEPLEGAVLVARHGEGSFVYTGISFFRQLPAGVPGAYRLFANLLALGGAR